MEFGEKRMVKKMTEVGRWNDPDLKVTDEGGGGDNNKSCDGSTSTSTSVSGRRQIGGGMTGRGRRPRRDARDWVPKVKPPPKTHEEEMVHAKVTYTMITDTVVKAVEKSIKVFEKLGIPERKYRRNGNILSYSYGFVNNEFNLKTAKVQETLKQLDLTEDENCCSIFAHRIFLLAVYEYPQHAYPIALTLQNFFNTSPGQLHRNILVVTNLKAFMVAVLNRTTLYDYYLDPGRLSSVTTTVPGKDGNEETKTTKDDLEKLETDFPKLKSIRSNQGTLEKKIAERHLNAATFLGYLICMLADHGSHTFLADILGHLSFNIDRNNFYAIGRIVHICSHLIPYYATTTSKLLSRLSRFFESLKSDDLNIFKFRNILREMLDNLVIKRDLNIRCQDKILEQIGGSGRRERNSYKTYADVSRIELKRTRREERMRQDPYMNIIISKPMTVRKSALKLSQPMSKKIRIFENTNTSAKSNWEFGFGIPGSISNANANDCRIVEALMKAKYSKNKDEEEEEDSGEQICDEEEPFFDAEPMDVDNDDSFSSTVENGNLETTIVNEMEIFHDLELPENSGVNKMGNFQNVELVENYGFKNVETLRHVEPGQDSVVIDMEIFQNVDAFGNSGVENQDGEELNENPCDNNMEIFQDVEGFENSGAKNVEIFQDDEGFENNNDKNVEIFQDVKVSQNSGDKNMEIFQDVEVFENSGDKNMEIFQDVEVSENSGDKNMEIFQDVENSAFENHDIDLSEISGIKNLEILQDVERSEDSGVKNVEIFQDVQLSENPGDKSIEIFQDVEEFRNSAFKNPDVEVCENSVVKNKEISAENVKEENCGLKKEG